MLQWPILALLWHIFVLQPCKFAFFCKSEALNWNMEHIKWKFNEIRAIFFVCWGKYSCTKWPFEFKIEHSIKKKWFSTSMLAAVSARNGFLDKKMTRQETTFVLLWLDDDLFAYWCTTILSHLQGPLWYQLPCGSQGRPPRLLSSGRCGGPSSRLDCFDLQRSLTKGALLVRSDLRRHNHSRHLRCNIRSLLQLWPRCWHSSRPQLSPGDLAPAQKEVSQG